MPSSPREPPAFDATLVEPLWRNTTAVLLASAGITVAMLIADAALGYGFQTVVIIRATSLALYAGLGAIFWRNRQAPSSVIPYVFAVLLADMGTACVNIGLTGGLRSELYGTLYLLLLLPPLLLCYRPRVSLCLQLALLIPAVTTAMGVSEDIHAGLARAILLTAVAAFAFFMGLASYDVRRREFTATEELRNSNVALQEAQARLVETEKLSALGTLSACIAHELAQPLTLLLGYTTVLTGRLARGQTSPSDLEAHLKQLDVMQHAAKRMSAIIEHLRGYARRSGRPRCTQLNDAVHGALIFVRGDLTRAGVGLSLRLAESSPIVFADPIELEQVVLNLLTNARDALRGKKGASVEIHSWQEGEHGIVEVRDNGPGVGAELRERVFQLLFTTKPAGVGTGLGLWVSQGIVRGLGGSIALRDSEAGATFRVTLPLAPEEELAKMRNAGRDAPSSPGYLVAADVLNSR